MGRIILVCLELLIALLAVAFISLQVGEYPLPFSEVLSGEGSEVDRAVFLNRLIRILLAAGVGAALATVGVAFQAITRNPLADPFILGVSGGAALGASLCIAAGWSVWVVGSLALPLTPLAAFAGGLAALYGVYTLSMTQGRLSVYRLLLIGVVFNFFASAVIMLVKTLVGALEVRSVLLFLMGSLSSVEPQPVLWGKVLVVSVFTVFGAFYLFMQGARLNVISLGDEGARHLGVHLTSIRRRVFLISSAMVAAAVSVAGMIGFVGLIVPHAVRILLGADHRMLVPASALGGAVFLVSCDLVARLCFPLFQSDAPVGVVTALVGGPIFVWLLVKGRVHSQREVM